MITDPVCYRLFATSPETFFLLLGMTVESATDMAARYQYEALEFKTTSHRADGVFLPKEAGLPLYFLEVQFYYSAAVFADVLVKALTYLKQHDPTQKFYAVVLFADRAFEPEDRTPYQAFIDAGVIQRLYLEEMPHLPDAPLGLSILQLLRQEESQAPAQARQLIERTKREIEDEALRADLIQLIERVIIYKLPRLSREEIQAMLQIHDIRESRVIQEVIAEERERHLQDKLHDKLKYIARMAALTSDPEKIASVLELDVELVRKELAKNQ